MNKNELVQEVAKKANVSQKLVGEVLDALIETIEKTVSKGKKVTIVGFGTFESRKRAARRGRNPQTGHEMKISAKVVPTFTAGKKFKDLIVCEALPGVGSPPLAPMKRCSKCGHAWRYDFQGQRCPNCGKG